MNIHLVLLIAVTLVNLIVENEQFTTAFNVIVFVVVLVNIVVAKRRNKQAINKKM
ncbi:hypothetical protein MKY84_01425 [Chryseomicrobium sp. FSL W7-1435]|uniref:hypothetical protein n=1 Tax=Chryseomicrobium sp. FSL W7-1435 TaxID=2921704 RepID=UPI00315AB491